MENYEKIRVVGRGAYGTVHLCKRLSDKKHVIIKQIPVEQMTKDERQSALNEVKVLSMLSHPNIIEYYENFLEDKALMIVMEYAQGGTLLDYLQSQNNRLLEEEEILLFFAQMLLSIQHVHSKQILHRDLKTQNILLDKKKKVVKIGDFGISKVLSSKSKAYTVVGTPCYISPELCEGKPYNQKSDIWALGCVLYELASLKRAFEAANLPALILKIMRGTFAPISEHYSEELRSLILSMLHLDPNKRPDINQIMAQPIIINALINIHTDMGKVPCARMHRPVTPALPSTARNRLRGSAVSVRDSLPSKPQSMSSVYCWGGGFNTPIKLPLPTNDTQVVEVSAGRTQKAAVTKNGRLFNWESPGVGADSLIPGSLDTTTPGFIPRFLEGQSAVAIQHVACGDLFTACLTDRGILMTYGSGANGCLGHGNLNDVTQAKIVEALLGYEVVQVSCGASHVLAVTNENEVFAWGRGDNGRLGLGTQDSHTTPQAVQFPEGVSPCSVNCGVDCSMVITLDNKLFCCGNNRYNKCCLDEINQEGQTIRLVEEVRQFTKVTSPPIGNALVKTVSMGTSHSAIVTVDGELYTCGANQFGQLGYQTDFNNKQASQVEALKDVKIHMVACGDTFTTAVSQEAEVFSFGKSARGRLGRSDPETMTPKRINIVSDELFSVVSISCSHGSTLLATRPLQGMVD
ncbi:serine/threonine-protein kinase Nek8-like [Ruditapes philippinarum]|uniref:serine/threonine-protein kinase Nek8-like n=1 Tax=Ruditapes philippinarum TaxID=129788 RepID=UPI00295B2071|nr:serine/threonine-protein kinase Nek8-like [Ruditapes philippinarum]